MKVWIGTVVVMAACLVAASCTTKTVVVTRPAPRIVKPRPQVVVVKRPYPVRHRHRVVIIR